MYSQHFQASELENEMLQLARSLPPSWRLGIVGLALLGGLIWGVAELGNAPPVVEAQEAQASIVRSPASSWQSASFPVENFVAYTSPFGYRQDPYGGQRFHYGLDIAAPMGSYIRAWWEGEVVEVSDDTACGTSVVVQSGEWIHIYCHLQGYVVVEKDGDRWLVDSVGGVQIRQGDSINSGKRIGRIGMTGRTTGPHLHWGLKYRGNWVDPSSVLQAMVADSSPP
ncbi:MAG: M23 family metallopeptidase [Cyanobacteria bacterium J06559_3]